MDTISKDKELQWRLSRDQANADRSMREAERALVKIEPPKNIVSTLQGVSEDYKERLVDYKMRRRSLEQVKSSAFQAMVEVCYYTLGKDGDLVEHEKVWYANEGASRATIFGSDADEVVILPWTHPGIQMALATDTGDYGDIKSSDLNLRGVAPLAKARFDSVHPDISGVYDPGGSVRPAPHEDSKTGLKAVKLKMTSDQVKAFIARMSGMMIVTGAPGSGKTTVALQRIRFLIDQQGEREAAEVEYKPELTRVFLANRNLSKHAIDLFKGQLDLPESIIIGVDDFVKDYIEHAWSYKNGARLRSRKIRSLEVAARTAVLGLSTHEDLAGLWECFEIQISRRLGEASQASWMETADSVHYVRLLAAALEKAVVSAVGRDPTSSRLSMGQVFERVKKEYTDVRENMNEASRGQFDENFQRWLFWVYDPLSAIESYFGERQTEAGQRMRDGTAGRVNEAEVIERIQKDWRDRIYGEEDQAWIAWLLRFCLPDQASPDDRFLRMRSPVSPATTDDVRWTHIAIDEAQDLSVAQASLLGSLVDPKGALTVSADFRQIVSPVHGMHDARAFEIGRSIPKLGADQIYPFAKNMRQSRQIGEFLGDFFEVAFRQRRPFAVNMELNDVKPQVIIAEPRDYARRIRQIVSALSRSDVVESIALLQINENRKAMDGLRRELTDSGVLIAQEPIDKGLLMSSAEQIKGLEFDACIVLGFEDVEKSAPNFALNRAYVSLSRPARRLVMICSERPSLLRNVDRSLFEVMTS